jgi:hypothetical protein
LDLAVKLKTYFIIVRRIRSISCLSLHRLLPGKSLFSFPLAPRICILPVLFLQRIRTIKRRLEYLRERRAESCYALSIDPEAVVGNGYHDLEVMLINKGDILISADLVANDGVE